ncbi:hypothetical protein [Phormidium sp. CCY1219]|nr:hypothetical protein [Phormidium sp. CCY1219]MEB3827379.1 hypothetical protein [Phormidium sp. CCY1219]
MSIGLFVRSRWWIRSAAIAKQSRCSGYRAKPRGLILVSIHSFDFSESDR